MGDQLKIIICKDDVVIKNEILLFYNSPGYLGINKLRNKVDEKFAGITREDTKSFVMNRYVFKSESIPAIVESLTPLFPIIPTKE